MKRSARIDSAIAASVGLFIGALGLLSAFAGLPLWLSIVVGLTAVIFGVQTYRRGKPPTSPAEIVGFVVVCGVLALAVRGADDLVGGGGNGSYRYFVTDLVVYSHIAPWSKATTADAFREGQEFQVLCRTEGLRQRREIWLRLEDGTYIDDSSAYQDYSSRKVPGDC
jgi:hypothetical protein